MNFKRSIMVLLAILLCIVTLAPVVGAKKTTLTFMTPLSGADGAYMDKIIAGFNAKHPDIEVVHLVVGSSLEYKMKLSTGISSKNAPQVLFMRKGDTPALLQEFRSFTAKELKSDYGIDINDIYPNLLKGLTKGSQIYGIPLDCWIFYLAYNRANFKKAGLDPDKPPTNREEWMKAMEALKAVTPKGLTPYYESPTWSWLWLHLMWQFGGDLLTSNFKKPAFEKAGAQALRLIMEMQEKGYFPSGPVDPGPPFHAGDTSVLITGIWTINPFMEALGQNFGAATAPQLGTHKAVFGGSHVLALPKVMVKDPQALKAAMTWVKYLWDNAIDWYAAGQTPARKSIAESKELKEKLPHIYTVSQQLPYVKTFQMFPYISEVLDEIAVYLERVLIKRDLTPEQAMALAAENANKILEDYWAEQ